MLGSHQVKEEGLDINQNSGSFTAKKVTKSNSKFITIKNNLRVPIILIDILKKQAIENKIPPVSRVQEESSPSSAWSTQPKVLADNGLQCQPSRLPEKKSWPTHAPSSIPPKGLAESRLEKIQANNAKLGNRPSSVAFYKSWESKQKIRNERKVPTSEECGLPVRPLLPMVLPEVGKCLCQRPIRTVLCRFCGYHCRGNIKAVCTLHPKTIYLNAIDTCPNCKALKLLIEMSLN